MHHMPPLASYILVWGAFNLESISNLKISSNEYYICIETFANVQQYNCISRHLLIFARVSYLMRIRIREAHARRGNVERGAIINRSPVRNDKGESFRSVDSITVHCRAVNLSGRPDGRPEIQADAQLRAPDYTEAHDDSIRPPASYGISVQLAHTSAACARPSRMFHGCTTECTSVD